MRIASDTLPRRATHCSDGTAFICHPCPPPWPRCAVSGLLKTRNQLIMRAHRVEVLGWWWYSFCTTSHQLSPPPHRVLSQILLRRACKGSGPSRWRGGGGQRGALGGRRAALVARRASQLPLLAPGQECDAAARGLRRLLRFAPSPGPGTPRHAALRLCHQRVARVAGTAGAGGALRLRSALAGRCLGRPPGAGPRRRHAGAAARRGQAPRRSGRRALGWPPALPGLARLLSGPRAGAIGPPRTSRRSST